MALKEEFEYVGKNSFGFFYRSTRVQTNGSETEVLLFFFLLAAFRCAYCYFMNPARKTRPHAPRLPEYSYERKLRGEVRSPGHVQPTETETQDSAPPSGGRETFPLHHRVLNKLFEA